MLFLIFAAALLQGSSDAGAGFHRRSQPRLRARRASRRERRGRHLGRLEIGRMAARDVGAGVGPRAGLDARRRRDRLLVGSIRQVRSLARRHARRTGRRAGARATHVVLAGRRRAGRAARRTHRVRPWPSGSGSSLDSLDDRLRVPPHEGFRGRGMARGFARRCAHRVRLDRRRVEKTSRAHRGQRAGQHRADRRESRAPDVVAGRRPTRLDGDRRARRASTSRRSTATT